MCVVFIAHFLLIAGIAKKQKVQLAVTLIYGEIERVISYGGDKSNKKVNSGRDTFIILTCKYHASEITLLLSPQHRDGLTINHGPLLVNFEAIFTVSRFSSSWVLCDATFLTTPKHF